MATKKELVAGGMANPTAVALLGSVTTGITANTGSTQATGTLLTSVVNVVATCANAGDALLLPPASKGDEIWVRNNGAASADVFPQVGGAINGGSANAAFAVANTKTAVFKCLGGLDWIVALSA